jgi:hypothetical protein
LACLSTQIDRPSRREKSIAEGKEVDLFTVELSTAFDIPSLTQQRYVLRRCGLGALFILQKLCCSFAAIIWRQ